ncbi:hypothetical protein F5Y04DRAFT_288589 [Hypomontagnella monticulosa]|nr:hypothetical protein F5Y04DRAFT_288589 [Hypomontagnella monticulosa]
MESHIRRAPVGEFEVDVAQYALVKKAFFVISATGTHDAWLKSFHQPLKSIWIYAMPHPDTSTTKPNVWKIAVELDTRKMVTLELYDTGYAPRGSVVLIRAFTEDQDPAGDFAKLMGVRAMCLGRKMLENVTFGTMLSRLQEDNLFMYQLNAGRGYRHWAYSVIKSLEDRFIYKPPMTPPLSKQIDEKMRLCYLANGNFFGRPGYEDELDNPMTIVAGKWSPAVESVEQRRALPSNPPTVSNGRGRTATGPSTQHNNNNNYRHWRGSNNRGSRQQRYYKKN